MIDAATRTPVLGLLVLDAAATLLPGSVCNAATFGVRVEFQVVPGTTATRCLQGDRDLIEPMVSGAENLAARGADFISSNCGFLAHYQEAVSAAVRVPVCLSALGWLPTLLASTPISRRIGVLTFEQGALGPELLRRVCREGDLPRLVIRGASALPAWAALNSAGPSLSVAAMERELCDLARSLVDEAPDVGPLLLECTAMAPFAPRLRAALARPVFDINGMIFAFLGALSPITYTGVEPPPASAGISIASQQD